MRFRQLDGKQCFSLHDDDVNKELMDEMIPSIKEGSVLYTKKGALELLKEFNFPLNNKKNWGKKWLKQARYKKI